MLRAVLQHTAQPISSPIPYLPPLPAPPKKPSAVLETNADPESSHQVHFQRTVPGCIFLCIQPAHAPVPEARRPMGCLRTVRGWEGGQIIPKKAYLLLWVFYVRENKMQIEISICDSAIPSTCEALKYLRTPNSTMLVVRGPPKPPTLSFQLPASMWEVESVGGNGPSLGAFSAEWEEQRDKGRTPRKASK